MKERKKVGKERKKDYLTSFFSHTHTVERR